MAFLGTFKHIIDDKNRLVLPTKIASKFLDKLAIITKGFDGCLELWTVLDFKKKVSEILSFSQNKKDSRILTRQILANSYDIEIDKLNRILLPTNLKQIAKLEKDVVIIGLGNKIEIWNSNFYEKFKTETDKQFEQVAERIENEFNK